MLAPLARAAPALDGPRTVYKAEDSQWVDLLSGSIYARYLHSVPPPRLRCAYKKRRTPCDEPKKGVFPT